MKKLLLFSEYLPIFFPIKAKIPLQILTTTTIIVLVIVILINTIKVEPYVAFGYV